MIHRVGAMQKRDPANFACLRHDARFTQEAHDSEGLKKKAMQAAEAKNKRGQSSRSAQLALHGWWTVRVYTFHIHISHILLLADRLHRHLNAGSGLMSVNAVLLSCF